MGYYSRRISFYPEQYAPETAAAVQAKIEAWSDESIAVEIEETIDSVREAHAMLTAAGIGVGSALYNRAMLAVSHRIETLAIAQGKHE